MRHLALIRVKTLVLAGLILLMAGAYQPAWGGFPDWRKYLEIINPTSATLHGTVQGYSADPLPMIVVFYYDADEPQRGVLGSRLTQNKGDFGFSVKAPGRYRILPKKTAYYLLFSYSGDFSLMINRNNDGAVSLASMLDPRAQAAARRTFGFNEDHGGILSSPAVLQVVHTILSNSEVQAPWVEGKIE